MLKDEVLDQLGQQQRLVALDRVPGARHDLDPGRGEPPPELGDVLAGNR